MLFRSRNIYNNTAPLIQRQRLFRLKDIVYLRVTAFKHENSNGSRENMLSI